MKSVYFFATSVAIFRTMKEEKKMKRKENLAVLLILIGIALAAGTAGASDLEIISPVRETVQLVVSLLFAVCGLRTYLKGENYGNHS